MHGTLISDIATCMVAAFACAVFARWLRQPAIIAYLAAGIIAGPLALGWVKDREAVQTIGELGLIFLLFMIGLEIDLKKIARAGQVIAVTALLQIALCFLFAIAVFALAGFSLGAGHLDALYFAIAATFSSTIIIVKLLYDKRELETLAGRITLGVLVMQDLAAILFLALQGQLANPSFITMALALGRVIVLVAAAFAVSRYVLPALFKSLARQPELLLIGALAWCFAVSGFAAWLGLSREMGALIAGVALSTFPYTLDVAARVNTLRDFFVTLFFVSLGMQIPSPDLGMVRDGAFLALALVTSRWMIVFPVLYFQRMGVRGSALPTINLGQVSEFALVIAAIGVTYGHIGQRTIGVILYAFVLLAIVSSYAITNSDGLTRALTRTARRFRFMIDTKDDAEAGGEHGHGAGRIYLLGFYTAASSLLEELARRRPEMLERIVVVDFNPEVAHELRKRNIRVVYGDISQHDTLIHAGLASAEVILCTLPDAILKGASNLRLAKAIRTINPNAHLIMNADALSDVEPLYNAGATYVSVSRLIEADHLFDIVGAAAKNDLAPARDELAEALRDRREIIR
jgi:Kef-type K+ transport system membrane component KefB